MIYQIQRNITFTALSAGEYKFCYKKASDTLYTCTTSGNHIVVTSINTPETYPVTLDFDSEDCTHDYDISISPVCDDEKVIELNAVMQSPSCKTYNLRRASGLPILTSGDQPIVGCNTNAVTFVPNWFIETFRLGLGLYVCSGELPDNSNFDVVEGVDCNCQCNEWRVSLPLGGGANILYTSCLGEVFYESIAGEGGVITFCAVGEVSVASQTGDSFLKVNLGSC